MKAPAARDLSALAFKEPIDVAPTLAVWRPYKVSIVWMAGTFITFLTLGDVAAVPSPWKLIGFIAATLVAFTIGYLLSVANQRKLRQRQRPVARTSNLPTRLIVASALFYLLYALASMLEFDVASVQAVINGITHPGDAYYAKFQATELQAATGSSNPALRALTLVSALSAPMIPLATIHWRRLRIEIRALVALACLVYALFYLAIGTLVGLGNLVILFATGIGVATSLPAGARKKGMNRRWAVLVIAIFAVGFAGYMSYNQSGRIISAGGSSIIEANPVVERLVGRNQAEGIAATIFYPTHGYQGLGYDLDTPFEWTYGRGSSRGLDGYLAQYGLGESQFARTYPARAALTTGWDANLHWSTIYPWLASDLTFPGAILFIGLVGWWLARLWHESVLDGHITSILLLSQVALLIAFIPANNQVVIGRAPLICVMTLMAAYFIARLNRVFTSPGRNSTRRRVGALQ